MAVARHIVKREIGRLLGTEEDEYEPKNFSIQNPPSDRVRVNFRLDPELCKLHEEEIKKLPGFSLNGSIISFEYQISDADRRYYEDNKDLLKRTLVHEFMDFKFPEYFGYVVSIVIAIVSIVGALL